MYLTNFEYKGSKTSIQCNPNDKMLNICKKFSEKLSVDFKSIYFIYSGNPVNFDLTFIQIANSVDKLKNQINVLVYSNDIINIIYGQIKLTSEYKKHFPQKNFFIEN